jgi:RNA polymerase sigma-70 factor (ECF subfamily)
MCTLTYYVKSSLFIELLIERSNSYNIADTTLSAEDELIQSKIYLVCYVTSKLKPHYQELYNYVTFKDLPRIANAINEPLSSVKIKLLRAKKIIS